MAEKAGVSSIMDLEVMMRNRVCWEIVGLLVL